MLGFLLVLILLLVIGMPVAFAMAIVSAGYIVLFWPEVSNVYIPRLIAGGANSFILLAVPFFLLAGELMNAGGVTRRLVRFAEAVIGSIRGGLSYVVIVVNMIMAGVSGAAIADAAAVGSVMVPSMVKAGYRPGFSAAVNAAAATIGPIIPPSVGFLIYASLANCSVGKLFAAGAIPGFIMGAYMMVVCYVVARRQNLPRGERTSLRKFLSSLWDASWALLMPIIILGGILGGIVTPTEAGVIAVLYGFFVGVCVYREIRLVDIPRILAKTAKQTAIIMFVIACAQAFGFVLTRERAPDMLLSGFDRITEHAWVFLLILNGVIILLGCFMEGGSIMIILTPLLLPLLHKYDVDVIHFGVVFQLNIMIGLLTPPVGMLLYVITGVSGIKMQTILRDLWPFFVVLVICLLLITFVPSITLFLPGRVM